MRLLRSLRARLLLGSVLWTLGLLPLAHVLSLGLIVRFPLVAGIPRVIVVRNPAHTSDLVKMALLHYGGALAVAVVLMIAGLLLIRSGLSPLNQLRVRLAAVHEGRQRRVEGDYPTEVQPLVTDLNALLEQREEAVRRAIAKAGDLAHGLKTPLAVLARDAEQAREAGHLELAATIGEQVERMRRQMDYYLAHARASASGAAPGAQTILEASVAGLRRALQRLHADRGIAIDVNVPSDHAVRAQREDVDEMVGNLMDNACRWATARVAIRSEKRDGTIVLLVEDDGAGLTPSLRDAVLQRGVKADETAPGTGFGLAIVRDLAELYGGSIALGESPLGGLCATLTLPAR